MKCLRVATRSWFNPLHEKRPDLVGFLRVRQSFALGLVFADDLLILDDNNFPRVLLHQFLLVFEEILEFLLQRAVHLAILGAQNLVRKQLCHRKYVRQILTVP